MRMCSATETSAQHLARATAAAETLTVRGLTPINIIVPTCGIGIEFSRFALVGVVNLLNWEIVYAAAVRQRV
jgi:hypothetical protein